MHSERVVIVFTGGDAVDLAVREHLPAGAYVIAADSGVDQAAALGVHVDLAVGDFDSVSTNALDAAAAAGARVETHPEAKDATDLELGLVAAAATGITRVIVVGGHGGRLDHFLANALLLCSPAFAALRIEALVGPARLTVVHDRVQLRGRPSDLVSLLPVGGPALGVLTEGLLYPLNREPLTPGTTRGVSNEFVAPVASVELEAGTLLAVQPGVAGTHLIARTAAAVDTQEI